MASIASLSVPQSSAEVFQAFADISAIPRCSGCEADILAFLISEAQQRGHKVERDAVGNALIRLPASPGLEGKPGLIIQAHVDMVCEQNEGRGHDFSREGISPVRDGEWLRADGTTLGADNGIAVAMMLAILRSSVPHTALDLLFTVDEESGLTGALQLDPKLLHFDRMLNLDGEEEGIFYIGCAGGKETVGSIPVHASSSKAGITYRIALKGLEGGHSGADIHLQKGNAVKLMGRLLGGLYERKPFALCDIRGGDKHNAIPRECFAIVQTTLPKSELESAIIEWQAILREEFGKDEPQVALSVSEHEDLPAWDQTSTLRVLRFINVCPDGVVQMSRTMPGLVSTSTNLAAVRVEQGEFKILTSQRSDQESMIQAIAEVVRAAIEAVGGTARFVRQYGGWAPKPDAWLVNRVVELYKKEFPSSPYKVGAIHAGLECGVIGSKRKGMEMVSFGPDIKGAHTPQEKLHVDSTDRCWKFVKKLVADL